MAFDDEVRRSGLGGPDTNETYLELMSRSDKEQTLDGKQIDNAGIIAKTRDIVKPSGNLYRHIALFRVI